MIFPKKEMKYYSGTGPEILAGGDIFDAQYKYLIVNHAGSYPCCYIGIPNGKEVNTDDIHCHGGVTWCGGLPELLYESIEDKEFLRDVWWIGWDYAHYGDWIYVPNRRPTKLEKEWTTRELWDECMTVINHFIALDRREEFNYDQT